VNKFEKFQQWQVGRLQNLTTIGCFTLYKMKPNSFQGFGFLFEAWLMVRGHSVSRGSRVWNKITVAWRRFSKHIAFSPPMNDDEVFTTNLWWSTKKIGSNFHFD